MNGAYLMRNLLARILPALLLLLVVSAVLRTSFAQSTTGTILGTVADETGAVIPDALVTVQNLGTGEQHASKSDSSGAFTLPSLQVGHSSITVTHAGFTPVKNEDVEIQVAQRATFNPVLHVGATTDTVTVIANTIPLLNEASSSVGQVIDTQAVQNPGYNKDRGPASFFAVRLHWEI